MGQCDCTLFLNQTLKVLREEASSDAPWLR